MSKKSISSSSKLLNSRLLGGSVLLLSTLLPSFLLNTPVDAVELPGGQTSFDRAPRLVRTSSSFNTRNNSAATYYFTIEVPENAGEPLKAVKIEQRNYSTRTVTFKEDESRAFMGSRFAQGSALSLAPVGGSSQPGEITVEFDSPVPAGSIVTVAVDPERNPRFSGVYQFGVTAFPEGENSPGLYLGSRSIKIYGGN